MSAVTIYIKRPRVGQILETRFGQATVTRVYGRGESIVIEDSIGRTHLESRADAGWWLGT